MHLIANLTQSRENLSKMAELESRKKIQLKKRSSYTLIEAVQKVAIDVKKKEKDLQM